MALYDQVFAEVNGGLLAEATEIETDLASDITQIKTIVRGFSGISPGSPVRTVKFKSPVPISGPEFDFEKAMITSTPVALRLTLGASGKTVTMSEAYVIGPVTLMTGVGKATEQDVTLVGKGAPFA